MLTIQQIKDTVADYFKDKPVKSVYLFGSYARGEAKEGSDVDLLVAYDKDKKRLSLFDVLGFKVGLEELLNSHVDLVQEGFIYPRIAPFIEKEKLLIFDSGK